MRARPVACACTAWLAVMVVLGCSSRTGDGQVREQVTQDADAGSAAGEPEIAWGEAVNGLQAGLAMRVVQEAAGPSLQFTRNLRNVGEEPLRVFRAEAWPQHPTSTVWNEITDRGEIMQPYRGPQPAPAAGRPTAADYVEILPGGVESQSYAIALANFASWWDLREPRRASAAFVFRFDHSTTTAWDAEAMTLTATVSGLWTGEARSPVVEIGTGRVLDTPGRENAPEEPPAGTVEREAPSAAEEGVSNEERVLAIALARLAEEPFSDSIDVHRVTVKMRIEGVHYVDFAWQGAGEILPGMWERGYHVVIDPRTGEIREAGAYKR